jgi:hypothetical protein
LPMILLIFVISCKIKIQQNSRSDNCESTTTRNAGGLDFTAIGGKRQGREVPQSLRVEPGAKHPVWKTQLKQMSF